MCGRPSRSQAMRHDATGRLLDDAKARFETPAPRDDTSLQIPTQNQRDMKGANVVEHTGIEGE